MHLLLVTPGFPKDEADDSCIPPLQAYVRELARAGLSLSIIALDYPFRQQPYRWHGIRVYPCGGQNRRLLRCVAFWRAMRHARKIAAEHPVQVVHSFWLGSASFVAGAISKMLKIKHVCTLMGQEGRSGLFNALLLPLKTCGTPHALVVLSAFHQQQVIRAFGPRPVQRIPWGIAPADMPGEGPKIRAVDIIGVGSLLPVKNWAKWLHTVHAVAQIHPNLSAVLIGEGPERQNLQQLARRLDLGKHVRFMGHQPRQKALQAMQNAKILLHTADYESFGYVLAEAAYLGCKVIGTPVGLLPELPDAVATDDLPNAVLHGLQHAAPAEKAPFFDIQETVQAYLKLYGHRS